MEFHEIPWDLECASFDDTSSSMEFHGIWSVIFFNFSSNTVCCTYKIHGQVLVQTAARLPTLTETHKHSGVYAKQ